jgi:hydrogenase nickel insertion protein HypA
MHEFSVAESIFETITPLLPAQRSAVQVHVTVGPLAGICVESLTFCFEELARDHGLAGSKLVVKKNGTRMRCSCGEEYQVERFDEACPKCGGFERAVLSGREFTIDYLEVEE